MLENIKILQHCKVCGKELKDERRSEYVCDDCYWYECQEEERWEREEQDDE